MICMSLCWSEACTHTAAGEYIAAEKLEVDFGSCDLVEQIWVYGNSYEVSHVA